MGIRHVVKDARSELAAIAPERPCCRQAQVCTGLRFMAEAYTGAGTGTELIAVQAASYEPAAWLRAAIRSTFGYQMPLSVRQTQETIRYVGQFTGQQARFLARQGGLIDAAGRPIYGLAQRVIGGSACDCRAAWRAAFITSGVLSVTPRTMRLEIICPTADVALALTGAARRIHIKDVAVRTFHGIVRVSIRNPDSIQAILVQMGAVEGAQAWEDFLQTYHAALATRAAAAGNPDANAARSATASMLMITRAVRALEILGPEAPADLRRIAELRIQHPSLTLTALGQLADPVMSKNAMNGRLRRLVELAEATAARRGIPGPAAVLAA